MGSDLDVKKTKSLLVQCCVSSPSSDGWEADSPRPTPNHIQYVVLYTDESLPAFALFLVLTATSQQPGSPTASHSPS